MCTTLPTSRDKLDTDLGCPTMNPVGPVAAAPIDVSALQCAAAVPLADSCQVPLSSPLLQQGRRRCRPEWLVVEAAGRVGQLMADIEQREKREQVRGTYRVHSSLNRFLDKRIPFFSHPEAVHRPRCGDRDRARRVHP